MRSLTLRVALVLGSLAVAAAAGAAPQDNAQRGRQLFLRDRCYTCHGTQGAGGGIAGPKLAPDPLPFEAVLMQLRAPVARMPLYTRTVLSDADAADIYAYLKSVPSGPPAARIPLLNLGSMKTTAPAASGPHHTPHAAPR